MLDTATPRFYAISELGYGRAFTPKDAVRNYMRIQIDDYSPLVEDKHAFAEIMNENLPGVWVAPPLTVGYADGEWILPNGKTQTLKSWEQVQD